MPQVLSHSWDIHGRLMVSRDDPNMLVHQDGKPFFWMGDTGWELFHLLTRNETRFYLKTRAEQGFNVIQAVLISEFDGLTKPNAYGSLPMLAGDPTQPDVTPGSDTLLKNAYDYWDHVDFVVEEAARRGLFLALLPCWGEYVVPREGRRIFTTAGQAYRYGHFLGQRFRQKKNLIWVLGGDRLPDEVPGGVDIWRAMAKGIADGTNNVYNMVGSTDYSTTMMTYHCSQSSSRWFQNDAWLDFDMWGSYHDNFSSSSAYEQVYRDDSLSVIKPTINGEAAYEEHPVNWLPSNGYFTAYDSRQMAYWSVFAGAFGYTYGCNPVWQFHDSTRAFNYFAHSFWQKALFDEGAAGMTYLQRLMNSRPLLGRRPCNEAIVSGQGSGSDFAVATRGQGFAFIYLPTGKPVRVRLDRIGKRKVRAWWYDPRTGNALSIGDYAGDSAPDFTPPGISKELNWLRTGRGCDWVLVLDDADRGFPAPGSAP